MFLTFRYIYGGKLSLEEYDVSDIIKILVTANELSLQELIPYLESFLIKNKANLIAKLTIIYDLYTPQWYRSDHQDSN